MAEKITTETKSYRPFVKKNFPKVYANIPSRIIVKKIKESKNNTELKRKLQALEVRL